MIIITIIISINIIINNLQIKLIIIVKMKTSFKINKKLIIFMKNQIIIIIMN